MTFTLRGGGCSFPASPRIGAGGCWLLAGFVVTQLAFTGLLRLCFSKYGKRDHFTRKGALAIFSFWLHTCVLGHGQPERLAEKELTGENQELSAMKIKVMKVLT